MLYIISMVFFFIGFTLLLFKVYILTKDNNKPDKKRKSIKYCIILKDSLIINDTLDSIKNQTIKTDNEDIYLITNKKNNMYNINIIDKKINNVFNELVKKYDTIIFINSNVVLDKKYVSEIIKSYKLGYDIVIGNRILYESNFFTSISLIPNVIISTLNKNRIINDSNVLLNNDCFIINKEYIDININDDYDMTLYSINNKLTTYLNTNALYNGTNKYNIFKKLISYFKYRKNIIPSKGKNYGSQVNYSIGLKSLLYILLGFIVLIIEEIIKKRFLLLFTILLISSLLISILISLIIINDDRK